MLRPAAVLWSLLLAALLALLPCAATAATARPLSSPSAGPEAHGASARPGAVPVAGPSAGAVRTAATAVSHHLPPAPDPAETAAAETAAEAPGATFILCTAENPGPVPGHGCSSHPFCGPESHLPNAPPEPGTAVRPRLVAPPVTPAASADGTPTGAHHAPDLHALQVHRS
ncbi:hypothetical protein K353_03435 [Kitasatospora sp. SolWspMP-SS2h]|uniref:hypothetical protein n=1 Tax=Kitasatospora sp. SolWspMP-SS2h TaxID=1305729 RepID=UPI000DBA9C88|nr:hypothetical protein [Kitasatospora sp. SolWspMP-SS2h]RAJ40543.1 hypothetical protein K353_03435 [Kitasatospora sp. SolWspMP-SS2h]